MALSKRKIEKGLNEKGFRKKNKDHVTFRYITSDGTETSIFTHFSHGASGNDIQDWVIAKMAKQCKITVSQFKDLIDCPLSINEYENLLCQCGVLQMKSVDKQ